MTCEPFYSVKFGQVLAHFVGKKVDSAVGTKKKWFMKKTHSERLNIEFGVHHQIYSWKLFFLKDFFPGVLILLMARSWNGFFCATTSINRIMFLIIMNKSFHFILYGTRSVPQSSREWRESWWHLNIFCLIWVKSIHIYIWLLLNVSRQDVFLLPKTSMINIQ